VKNEAGGAECLFCFRRIHQFTLLCDRWPWSTSPIVFAQSYEYGQLCEIKPKLERWYGEEQGLRKCAIADNLGFLSV
jgi:hypothetical protein